MKRLGEIITGFFTLALGIVWFLMSFSLDQNNVGGNLGLGPGFYPKLVSVLLIVLSVVLLISLFKRKEKLIKLEYSFTAFFLILLCIAYLVLMNVIGYATTTFIYVLTNILILHDKKTINLVDVVSAFLVSASLYSIFHIFLKVPLPSGYFI